MSETSLSTIPSDLIKLAKSRPWASLVLSVILLGAVAIWAYVKLHKDGAQGNHNINVDTNQGVIQQNN